MVAIAYGARFSVATMEYDKAIDVFGLPVCMVCLERCRR